MNMGGLDTNAVDMANRKTCAWCHKEFKPNQGKTRYLNKYYHLSCYEKLIYKKNDVGD